MGLGLKLYNSWIIFIYFLYVSVSSCTSAEREIGIVKETRSSAYNVL